MLRTFAAKNFRCLRDFKIEPLEQVNLIVGESNVGKTALLEAIFLHSGPSSPELPFQVNAFRGAVNSNEGSWKALEWLFHATQTADPIELLSQSSENAGSALRIRLDEPTERTLVAAEKESATQSNGQGQAVLPWPKELVLTYTDQEGEEFPSRAYMTPEGIRAIPAGIDPWGPVLLVLPLARLSDDHARRYSDLAEEGRVEELIPPLRVLDPRIQGIALLYPTDGPVLYANIGLGQLVPLPFMGTGVANLLSWLLAIKSAENGAVLIDEFGNGLHYSALVDVWKAVGAAARESNVQVFATTHSWECVVAAHLAFAESEKYDFRLHRLERRDGEVIALTYDEEQLATSIHAKLEVR